MLAKQLNTLMTSQVAMCVRVITSLGMLCNMC